MAKFKPLPPSGEQHEALNNYPITPPDDLLQQWVNNYFGYTANGVSLVSEKFFATQAAQWGWEQRGAANEAELQKARDEELDACCELLAYAGWGGDLRAARRPKPKSQTEEALEEIQEIEGAIYNAGLGCDFTATRRALERLREHEQQVEAQVND